MGSFRSWLLTKKTHEAVALYLKSGMNFLGKFNSPTKTSILGLQTQALETEGEHRLIDERVFMMRSVGRKHLKKHDEVQHLKECYSN